MAEFIFYASLLLILYTYVGYPAVLFLSSFFLGRKVDRGEIFPIVTVIIPVHNEEQVIASKLKNCLDFDYPRDKLKIVVVSDHSTDRTEQIVKEYPSESINCVSIPYRGGKVAAQNYAVRLFDSEIYIFTDVAISTNPDSIKTIVQNFNDESIGAVSCRDMVLDNSSNGEKNYIKYDMMVRKYTSSVSSMIGVTGGFYAVRREIAEGGWNPAFPPDFYVALRSIKQGLRVIEDSRVRAYYKTAAKEWDELARKARTINRGIHALLSYSNRKLLNPLKYGFISVELISHKLMRWMTPFLCISLFLSNLEIAHKSIFFTLCFYGQVVAYTLAAISLFYSDARKNNKVFKLLYFFVLANTAIAKAWYEYALGRKYETWQPTKR